MADSPVEQILQLANTWSVPLAQRLTGESRGTSDADFQTAERLLAERTRWSTLNGSGPNDAQAASEAPQTTLDFLTGQNLSPAQVTKRSSVLALVAVGLLAFLAWRVFRR